MIKLGIKGKDEELPNLLYKCDNFRPYSTHNIGEHIICVELVKLCPEWWRLLPVILVNMSIQGMRWQWNFSSSYSLTADISYREDILSYSWENHRRLLGVACLCLYVKITSVIHLSSWGLSSNSKRPIVIFWEEWAPT